MSEKTPFKINFALRDINDIVPWGEESPSLHWFGLTDADLWITAGEHTIYEYSDAARKFWDCDVRYNDYQLSRFLEDFSMIFGAIAESIPEEFYEIAEEFPALADRWEELHADDDDDAFDKWYFDDEYIPLTEWFGKREIDSGHLVGGPNIGFFRCGERIKLWWHSGYTLESGESIWTSPSGVLELPYGDFVSEVKRFFNEFFEKMDEQVDKALKKDWGRVALDKKRLAEENRERREGFEQKISLLKKATEATDWDKKLALYKKMCSEL